MIFEENLKTLRTTHRMLSIIAALLLFLLCQPNKGAIINKLLYDIQYIGAAETTYTHHIQTLEKEFPKFINSQLLNSIKKMVEKKIEETIKVSSCSVYFSPFHVFFPNANFGAKHLSKASLRQLIDYIDKKPIPVIMNMPSINNVVKKILSVIKKDLKYEIVSLEFIVLNNKCDVKIVLRESNNIRLIALEYEGKMSARATRIQTTSKFWAYHFGPDFEPEGEIEVDTAFVKRNIYFNEILDMNYEEARSYLKKMKRNVAKQIQFLGVFISARDVVIYGSPLILILTAHFLIHIIFINKNIFLNKKKKLKDELKYSYFPFIAIFPRTIWAYMSNILSFFAPSLLYFAILIKYKSLIGGYVFATLSISQLLTFYLAILSYKHTITLKSKFV